jgi:hypothetical protein
MATQVGALYTSLTLESSSFVSNTKRAADATEKMAARIDNAFGLAAGAAKGFLAAISVGAIAGLAKEGLDYAASLGETAQQLGVSAKALQQYSFAAGQVGVSQEQLQTGLARLTRTLGDAKEGTKSAVDAFARLGISQAEVQRLSPDDALRRVAEGLSKISDPAKRAAVEVDLFGKSGQKLDNLLSGGTAALDEMARAANELGIVLSDDQIQKADEAADKLELVKNALSANIAGVVADNANAIYRLADAIIQVTAAAGRGLTNLTDFISGLQSVSRTSGTADRQFSVSKLDALFDPAGTAQIGRNNRFISGLQLGGGGILSNGRAAPSAFVGGAAGLAGGAGGARRGGSSRSSRPELTPAQQRLNADFSPTADSLAALLDPGAVADLDALANSFGEIKTIAVDLSNVDIIDPAAIAASKQFTDNLTQGLGQAIVYGQSIGDALVSSIKAAGAELISSGLLSLLTGGGGGGALGGIFSAIGSIFGGFRAAGGPVASNKAYVVGEQGPELLVGASGTILPNRALSAGGGGQVINVDARGATDPGIVEAAARRGAAIGVAQAAKVYGNARRGAIPRGLG